jgi:hypothetical protein
MKDLYNLLDASKLSINIAARTATVNGSGVDLMGYEGAVFVPLVGSYAGNQGTWAFTTEESDDNTTYADVADKDIIGTEPTMSGIFAEAYTNWGYKGSKRYVRPVATLTGGGQNCNIGCLVIRGLKRHEPTH